MFGFPYLGRRFWIFGWGAMMARFQTSQAVSSQTLPRPALSSSFHLQATTKQGEGTAVREGPHTGQPFSNPPSAFMLQALWLGQISFYSLNWPWGEVSSDFRKRLISKVTLSQCVSCSLAGGLLFRSGLCGSALDFPPPPLRSLAESIPDTLGSRLVWGLPLWGMTGFPGYRECFWVLRSLLVAGAS